MTFHSLRDFTMELYYVLEEKTSFYNSVKLTKKKKKHIPKIRMSTRRRKQIEATHASLVVNLIIVFAQIQFE